MFCFHYFQHFEFLCGGDGLWWGEGRFESCLNFMCGPNTYSFHQWCHPLTTLCTTYTRNIQHHFSLHLSVLQQYCFKMVLWWSKVTKQVKVNRVWCSRSSKLSKNVQNCWLGGVLNVPDLNLSCSGLTWNKIFAFWKKTIDRTWEQWKHGAMIS